jgi:hypothetical protein
MTPAVISLPYPVRSGSKRKSSRKAAAGYGESVRRFGALALGAITLAGCAGSDEGREPFASIKSTEWKLVRVSDDERKLTLSFVTDDPKCELFDRVKTREGMAEVTLTVVIRQLTDAVACADIMAIRRVTIQLAEPLNGRDLIDGATGIEVPLCGSEREGCAGKVPATPASSTFLHRTRRDGDTTVKAIGRRFPVLGAS